MLIAILLGAVGGLFVGNGLPHFLRGLTHQRYPNAWGGGPIPNLVSGWGGLVIGAVALAVAFSAGAPIAAAVATALAILAIGLFHAGPGAFGRP